MKEKIVEFFQKLKNKRALSKLAKSDFKLFPETHVWQKQEKNEFAHINFEKLMSADGVVSSINADRVFVTKVGPNYRLMFSVDKEEALKMGVSNDQLKNVSLFQDVFSGKKYSLKQKIKGCQIVYSATPISKLIGKREKILMRDRLEELQSNLGELYQQKRNKVGYKKEFNINNFYIARLGTVTMYVGYRVFKKYVDLQITFTPERWEIVEYGKDKRIVGDEQFLHNSKTMKTCKDVLLENEYDVFDKNDIIKPNYDSNLYKIEKKAVDSNFIPLSRITKFQSTLSRDELFLIRAKINQRDFKDQIEDLYNDVKQLNEKEK